jgi:biopolymer transport protein ExbD
MSKRKKKRRLQHDEMALQITSMADIFTILLVFLLKSFATSSVAINPDKGMMIPEAATAGSAEEALKVMVSETSVSVEGNPVTTLTAYKFPAGDLQTNGTSKTVSAGLEKERKRQIIIAQANPSVKVDARIIVVADQRAPYSTIKSVLASAAVNGYTDFKLAVVKGD